MPSSPNMTNLIKCTHPKVLKIKCSKFKTLLKKYYPVENFWNGQNITVGCGKCYYCKTKYATIWSNRCKMETTAQNELGNNNNWFLTLTFERPPIINKDLKPYLYYITTNFIKKLRNKNRYYENGIRKQKKLKYVWVSEIGEKNKRVHLHMLLWNFAIKDLLYWKISKTNNQMYVSQILTNLWGRGIVAIENLTKENAAYLYKYEAKNYLQKCQSGGIGLTFFYTHLEDVLNEQQYQNRYFLKKYRQLIGDDEFLEWLKYELEQKNKFIKKMTPWQICQHYLKLNEKWNSINSKMKSAREF